MRRPTAHTMLLVARTLTSFRRRMNLGYDQSLFLVAFDHRSSFSRVLFGASEPLPSGVVARISDTKELIFEAIERSIARGAPRVPCGILVDEKFGASVAHKAK